MPIEFRCTGCGKLLRTADDSAGKQAQCPQCGTVLIIPSAAPPAPAAEPFNAYRSPAAPSAPFPSDQPFASIVPTQIEIGALFSESWTIFKARWAEAVVAGLIFIGISMLFNILSTIGNVAAQASNEDAVIILFSLGNAIVQFVLGIWLQGGMILFMLRIASGRPAQYSDMFAAGSRLLPLLGGWILVGMMCTVGLLLLIVPGVILMLMFFQFGYLVLERNMGVFDALSTSRQIMAGNKLVYFATLVLLVLIAIPVVLCTCGLGMLAFVPFMNLLQAVAYRMMSGQHRPAGQSPFGASA